MSESWIGTPDGTNTSVTIATAEARRTPAGLYKSGMRIRNSRGHNMTIGQGLVMALGAIFILKGLWDWQRSRRAEGLPLIEAAHLIWLGAIGMVLFSSTLLTGLIWQRYWPAVLTPLPPLYNEGHGYIGCENGHPVIANIFFDVPGSFPEINVVCEPVSQ
jgi:hypothetical protein